MSDIPIKILLIEDNPVDSLLVHESLQAISQTKYIVTAVERLSQAIYCIEREDPDVILLDLHLPDSQGITTFNEIFARTPKIPIVILSGNADEDLALQAVRQGAQDYIYKGKMEGDLLSRAIRYAIERQSMVDRILNLSLLDDLTQLYNRKGFFMIANQTLRLAIRSQYSLLLFYMDLDGLKMINDTHGHAEGDIALKGTSELLRKSFRTSDILARLGGDEFVGLAINSPLVTKHILIDRIHENLIEYNSVPQHPSIIRISIGVSEFNPLNPVSLDDLLNNADRAMYEDKMKYRNSKQ